MKSLKQAAVTLATAAALLGATAAHAVTWRWSYSGTGLTASGTFTTAGNAAVAEEVLSITGTRNGAPILGMVPLDTDGNYSYDNLFVRTAPYFTTGGLLFNMGGTGEDASVNLYFDDSDNAFHDLRLNFAGTSITDTVVTFSVTAVPEAATYAYMALGLVGLGVAARRRRAA